MTIEITKKHIVGLILTVLIIGVSFVGGYYYGKSNTVSKEDYTTARLYATYTADMLKALYSELGEPHINNTNFNTNARAIATLKAKATGKKYSEVKDKSYTLYELLDVSSLIKEE